MLPKALSSVTCLIILALVAGSCGGKPVARSQEQSKTTVVVNTTPSTTVPTTKAEPKFAAFTVSDLTITPSEVATDLPVTVQAVVTNTGDLEGTYEANLKVNGTTESSRSVILAAGSNQKVTFTISRFAAGTYIVTIGGETGTFTVKTAPATTTPTSTPPPERKPLELTSTVFQNNATIPTKYTCDGQDVSPALSWTQPPPGTKSFALICDDPDAPGGTWVHWVIFNIPETARELPEAVPTQSQLSGGALQGSSDFGRTGYGGPCPPSGNAHHYQFTLYALDRMLTLSAGISKGQLMASIEGHILEETKLVGLYRR